tara:strand:+ start:564 stop:917 length:354 start_codon:yes stop_codon:yes gene_type:complete
MSSFRSGTVTGFIVWKLTALVLLPIVLSVTAGCPIGRQAVNEEANIEQQLPVRTGKTLVPCDSLEDTLLTLLSLTGFVPESQDLPIKFVSYGTITIQTPGELVFDSVPILQPPRNLL